jgi:N-acetylglucosaminyldiphosphoundecaprenol N-acetyl-beta-D-mannosaminyltransferase
MTDTIAVAGIDIRTMTVPEYIDAIRSSVDARRCFTATYVHFHTINIIHRDVRARDTFARLDVLAPDGIAIMWGARLLGHRVERANNMVMEYSMPRLAELAVARGWSFFLLGSEPGVAERAADELRRAFPGIAIAGTHHGRIKSERENESIVAEIRKLQPTIVLVGMGQPRQEDWIVQNKGVLSGGAMIGVGGYLEKVSKRIEVYPEWVHRTRLYWLYRMLTEPRLFTRYTFGGLRFGWNILRARLRGSRA